MNRTKSRRGQPNTTLTVHGLFTIHGSMLICKYCKVEECGKHGLYKPYSFSKLVHFCWMSGSPSGDCSNQLSAWSCPLTTHSVGRAIIVGVGHGSGYVMSLGRQRYLVNTCFYIKCMLITAISFHVWWFVYYKYTNFSYQYLAYVFIWWFKWCMWHLFGPDVLKTKIIEDGFYKTITVIPIV